MKKTIVIFLLAIFTFSFCSAQEIEYKRHAFIGYAFYQDGDKLALNELIEKIESNAEVLHLMKNAKSKSIFATVLSFSGGALIGWPIGKAIRGGDANWVFAGIGAGMAILAIPIGASANKDAKKAVELYNASLNTTSFYEFKPEYKIIANSTGIGLSMCF